MAKTSSTGHGWRFFRAGGVDQVRLERGADLLALPSLDQKLWVALSCPTKGVEFDAKTLELIDSDNDGRVRAPEILAAVNWAAGLLKDPGDLTKGSDTLPLAAINDSTAEGKRLLDSARQILANLGKTNATSISVADTTDTAKIFASTRFNGDGLVPADSASDEATKAAILDIIACLGSEVDRSGAPGVDQARVDRFFTELQAYSDWWQQAETAGKSALPLGAATASAWDALQAVRSKIEDYFARCRLAAFDTPAVEALNPSKEDFHVLARRNLADAAQELAEFPLAKAEPGRALPLAEGLNPAWSAAVTRFQREVVTPFYGSGKTTLSASEWEALLHHFEDYQAWLAGKAGAAVESLGLARVRELLAADARKAITALIDKDKSLDAAMAAITAVDRLLRYYRNIYELLQNFVSFRNFYARERKAIFQVGTLYLDGRSCELCVRVDDAAKHASLATLAKTYLVYCDCTRQGSAEKMTIAAAVTAGDSDQLMVGRNGIFYDRKGQDWDATVTKIVDHPISIRQAILSPYKRIGRMISEQVEKMAAARDKAVTDQAAAGIAETAEKVGAGKSAATAPAPFDVAKFAGIFAAIGLALGAIGTAVASVVTGFMGLSWWQMPLAVVGIFAAISGPSVIIAALKLRERNLAPILDANGWAVNGRVMINIPFGGALTTTAQLPQGAQRSLSDPFKPKSRSGWWWTLLFLAVLGGGAYYAIKIYGIPPWLQEKLSVLMSTPTAPATPADASAN